MVDQCEQFIREKYNIFFREKLAAHLSNELCSEMYLTEPYDERHSRLAFAEIFPHHVESIIGVEPPFINNQLEVDPQASQILRHIGLIQPTDQGTMQFIHRTYAEYFTSKLLTSWLRRLSKFNNNREVYKFLLTEILSTEKYNGIRSFFDQQLKSVSLRNDTLEQFGEVVTELSIKTDLNICLTVIRLAVAENCVKIVELLINAMKGCHMLLWHCLFCTHASKGTILRIAIRNNNSQMVKLILDAAEGITKDNGPHELIANKDSRYKVRDTSIFLDVACSENRQILREVFRRSANKFELVTESDGLHQFILRGGQHEFLRAIFDELRNEKDFKKYLLACNSGGQTLLHYALIMPDPDDSKRCSDIVKLLLQEAANLNDVHVIRDMIFAADTYGINALDQVTVASREEFDNFKILEQLSPEIWQEVNAYYYNTSPFLFRMYQMRKELILYIKKNKTNKAKAILENAKTSHDPVERLRILLSNLCPPPPYKDDSKYSVLHYACAFKRFDIINELLAYAVNINDDGETLRNLIRSPNPPYLYVYEKCIIGDIEQKNCSYLTPFELIHFKDHHPLTDYADRIKHIMENLIENALGNNNKHAVKILREIPKKYAIGKIKISKFLKRIKDCSCSFEYNKSSCSCKLHSEEYGDEYYFDAFPINEMSDDDEATWI